MYTSQFEDDYGNVTEKQLPRPTVAHVLYEFLPLIDEHNKSRKNALALERQWLTKNCWFRLFTTFNGMSLVDLHRWDRYNRSGKTTFALFLNDGDYDFDIQKMANLVVKPLRSGKLRFRTRSQPSRQRDGFAQLVRIQDKDGNVSYDKGKPHNMTCFMCRRYSKKPQCTQWLCRLCGMPLCKMKSRDETCLSEHLCSRDQILGCNIIHRDSFVMPKTHLAYREWRSMMAKNERSHSVLSTWEI